MKDACTCPIRKGMSLQEIMSEIVIPEKYCTSLSSTSGAKGWMCENLIKELDKARVQERSFSYRKKQLKRQGYTEDEIKKMPRKRRRRSTEYAIAIDVDLDDLI